MMPDDASPSENSNTHPSANSDTPIGADQPTRDEQISAKSAESTPETGSETGQDRRFSPRRKKLLRVQVLDTMTGSTPFPGWVTDRSIGGICIEVDRELETGAILRVRRYEADKFPWVEVRVQSQRPFQSSWHLGCQFVRSPSWEILMQFG